MAIRKTIRTIAGFKRPAAKTPSVPLNQADLAAALVQLQETVNELQVAYNTHADAAHSGANKVAGTARTDAQLFTP